MTERNDGLPHDPNAAPFTEADYRPGSSSETPRLAPEMTIPCPRCNGCGRVLAASPVPPKIPPTHEHETYDGEICRCGARLEEDSTWSSREPAPPKLICDHCSLTAPLDGKARLGEICELCNVGAFRLHSSNRSIFAAGSLGGTPPTPGIDAMRVVAEAMGRVMYGTVSGGEAEPTPAGQALIDLFKVFLKAKHDGKVAKGISFDDWRRPEAEPCEGPGEWTTAAKAVVEWNRRNEGTVTISRAEYDALFAIAAAASPVTDTPPPTPKDAIQDPPIELAADHERQVETRPIPRPSIS